MNDYIVMSEEGHKDIVEAENETVAAVEWFRRYEHELTGSVKIVVMEIGSSYNYQVDNGNVTRI